MGQLPTAASASARWDALGHSFRTVRVPSFWTSNNSGCFGFAHSQAGAFVVVGDEAHRALLSAGVLQGYERGVLTELGEVLFAVLAVDAGAVGVFTATQLDAADLAGDRLG